jgi:hypothetical protein
MTKVTQSVYLRINTGSLAMFTAILRASSRVEQRGASARHHRNRLLFRVFTRPDDAMIAPSHWA